VISTHGMNLDAGAYFCGFFSALRSNPAFAGDAQRVLVVAPRLDVNYKVAMATQNFTDLARRKIRIYTRKHWGPGKPTWAAGSHSKDSDKATTFDAVDAIAQLPPADKNPGFACCGFRTNKPANKSDKVKPMSYGKQ